MSPSIAIDATSWGSPFAEGELAANQLQTYS